MLRAFLIRVLNEHKDGFHESERLTEVLRIACSEFQIELRHAGDYHGIGRISEQVLSAIIDADLVFADANSNNENVWYEIGFADRVQREKVICLSLTDRVLPFDRHDIRSIPYRASAEGYDLLTRSLRQTLRELICNLILRQLVEAENVRFHEEENAISVARRLESPRLKEIGRDWLRTVALDSRKNPFPRRTAIRALAIIGELSDELAIELTRPVVDENVRASIYEQLFQLRKPVAPAVWEYRADDLRDVMVLDAFAKASARYWLDGQLPDEWLRGRVAADTTVRKALIESLQELIGKETRIKQASIVSHESQVTGTEA